MDLPGLNVDATEAVFRARSLASKRGSDNAGPVDLLFALLDSADALRLIQLFEVDPATVRAALEFIGMGATWHIDRDAEDRIVDLARADAARLGQTETGSEHLVVALVRDSGSIASGILQSLGVAVEPAREAVRYLHGQRSDWQVPPAIDLQTEASAWAPMQSMPTSISPEDAAELLDMSMVNVEVGLSFLDRVIAIGQSVESSGVVVEMIALEVREAGAVLLWRTQTAEDHVLGTADLEATDDVGTSYELLVASWSGGGRESRGETIITPRPPEEARTLHIKVRGFGRLDWMDRLPPGPVQWVAEAQGSWKFEVPLDVSEPLGRG